MTAGIQHCFVFGLAGNDVFTLLYIEMRSAFDSQVIGFGRTRGENDFTRIGTNQIGNMITRFIHRLFGLPAKTV